MSDLWEGLLEADFDDALSVTTVVVQPRPEHREAWRPTVSTRLADRVRLPPVGRFALVTDKAAKERAKTPDHERAARQKRDVSKWLPEGWSRAWGRRHYHIDATRPALIREFPELSLARRRYFVLERTALDSWRLNIRQGLLDSIEGAGTLADVNRARLALSDRDHRNLLGVVGVVTDPETALKAGAPKAVISVGHRDGVRPRFIFTRVSE